MDFRIKQAELWREDVRDIIGLTSAPGLSIPQCRSRYGGPPLHILGLEGIRVCFTERKSTLPPIKTRRFREVVHRATQKIKKETSRLKMLQAAPR